MIILPESVNQLYKAHESMCRYFAHTRLAFTFDGKLVGDIGEAIVGEAFGIRLCEVRTLGVDGHASDGRSVQIKATGRLKRGPAFTPGEGIADHLIFVRIDFKEGRAVVLYNGPEALVRACLPDSWSGTKTVSLSRVLALDAALSDRQRLARRC